MELKGKRVLITGAGGFIGSHLVERLIKEECNIRVFLRYNSEGKIGRLEELPAEDLNKIEIFRGDLSNFDIVKKSIKGVDIIFHLGALISIPYSYENPREYIKTNTIGTLNILEAAKEEKVKKVIITSTSEVYGTALYSPIDEKHPLQAQSPYAASKIAADKIAESFYKSFDVPVSIIRPFNNYGPRQSMRAVIPTIIYQALTKEKVKMGSLEPKRDFLYVEDNVDGYIRIAKSDDVTGEVINIGTGRTTSIGEIVDMVRELIGKNFEVETDKNKIRPEKSEVKLLICDNSKAKERIGWEPKTSLRDGLKKTIEYIQKNIDFYNQEEGLK